MGRGWIRIGHIGNLPLRSRRVSQARRKGPLISRLPRGCRTTQAFQSAKTLMLVNRPWSPIPRPQSLIITSPFRTSRGKVRAITLKPTPHLFAKGAPSRLRNASPILVFAVLAKLLRRGRPSACKRSASFPKHAQASTGKRASHLSLVTGANKCLIKGGLSCSIGPQ